MLRIDIEDSSGTKLGSGPIITAGAWQGSHKLDKAGSFSFSLPVSDSIAQYIDEDCVLRPSAWLGSSWLELPGGIVGSLRKRAGSPTMLEVSGDDLLHELAEVIVRPAGLSSLVELADWSPVTPDYIGTLHTGTATERTDGFTWVMDTDDYLYIGHTSPFSRITFTLSGTVNNNVSGPLSYQYYSGNLNGWYSLADLVDETIDSGAPFAQSGDITYTMPDDWSDTSHESHTLYWVRIQNGNGAGYGFLDSVEFTTTTVDERIGALIGDALDTIIGYAPAGWTVDTTGDADVDTDRVYMQLSGETVLEALVKLSEQTGRHFRLGTGREVVWFDGSSDSGLRAINGADPLAVETHDELALITSIDESVDYFERVNGIYPYGSGQGSGRLTIADSTETHTGYTIDKANNHVYWTARTRAIEREQEWADIEPAEDTPAEQILAANSLLQRAVQYLSEHKDAQTQWTVTLAHVNQAIAPGQTIRVVYREVRDDYVAWDIDQDLNILEATTQVDANGVRTVALVLSTVQRWAKTDAEVLLDLYRKARDGQRRPQTLDVANLRYSALEPGEYGLVGFSAGGKLGPRYLPKHQLYSAWHTADVADVGKAAIVAADGSIEAAFVDYADVTGTPTTVACRVYNDAALTIGTASVTALTFNTERFDTAAIHSTSTNTGRLTAPSDGVYLISAAVEFASNATGTRYVYIRLNASTYIAIDGRAAVNGIATRVVISTIYQLSATDYVELLVRQDSGGDLAIASTAAQSPEFGMARIV